MSNKKRNTARNERSSQALIKAANGRPIRSTRTGKLLGYPSPNGGLTKYRPELCEEIIPLMAEGKFQVQIAAELGISEYTLINWKKKYPEFAKAMEIGQAAAITKWIEKGEKLMWAKEGKPAVYAILMRNLAGWTDARHESTNYNYHEVHGEVKIDTSDEHTAEALRVLLESGAIEAEFEEISNSEAD